MPFFQLKLFDSITARVRRRRDSRKPPVQTPKRRKKFKDDPFLKSIWCEVRQSFFPDRPDLDTYTVYWSSRNQIRTLASCNIERKRISVARELNHPHHHGWLEPLLYHEMCHAYLEYNVSETGGRKNWHGKEFRAIEKRHPGVEKLDEWIKSGGWLTAVRSHRARAAHARRKATRAA